MALYIHTQTHVCAHCAQQGVFVYMQSLEELCADEQSPVSNPTFDSLCNEFPFQKSFRSKFLCVAELLHGEGFQVSSFSYLKLGFLKLEMYSACCRIDELWDSFGRQRKGDFSKYNRGFCPSSQ